MPRATSKQRLSTSTQLTKVSAEENGNGVGKKTKGGKSDSKQKIMHISEFRNLLKKKLNYDIGNNAKHIKNWIKAKKPYLPPRSPFSLLQELFFYDPWKVLIACMFLNKTSGKQVSTVLYKFFSRYPTPVDLQVADREDVVAIIKPLGLYNKRADMVIHFTIEYLKANWKLPNEIKGIGDYANDAYRIFCCGEWDSVTPHDHALNKYHEWLSSANLLELKGVSVFDKNNNNSSDSDSQNPRDESVMSDDDSNEKEEIQTNNNTKNNKKVKESKSAHHQAFLVAGELKWNLRLEDLNISQEEKDWWSKLFEIRDYFYNKFQQIRIEPDSDEEISSENEESDGGIEIIVRKETKKSKKRKNVNASEEKKSVKRQKIDNKPNKSDKNIKIEGKQKNKPEKTKKKKNAEITRLDLVDDEVQEPSINITKTNLPAGWRIEIRKRVSGESMGREDYYWYSPEGKKFRSLVAIRKYLAAAKGAK